MPKFSLLLFNKYKKILLPHVESHLLKVNTHFLLFQIDNIQALVQCPGVLVCVGREPSHPSIVENFQKSIKLPKLNVRSRSDVCTDEQEGRRKKSVDTDVNCELWF